MCRSSPFQSRRAGMSETDLGFGQAERVLDVPAAERHLQQRDRNEGPQRGRS